MLERYQAVLRELERAIEAAQAQQTGSIWMCGAILVFGALLFLLPGARAVVPAWCAICAIPAAGVYGRRFLRDRALAFQHYRLSQFYRRGIDRLNHAWAGQGHSGEEFQAGDHLYQRDLNILGGGSLFELLCTARTGIGRARLASYLLDLPEPSETRARQRAVQELAPRNDLREAVHLLGSYEFQDCEWRPFEEWLRDAPVLAPKWLRIAMILLSTLLLSVGILIFAMGGWTPESRTALVVLALVQTGLARYWIPRTRPVLERIRRFGADIRILREGLELLRRETFQAPRLQALAATAGSGAIDSLRSLERRMRAVDECNKEWFLLPSRALLIHVQLALAIERWKAQHGRELERWIDAWAEFEALNALACYAAEHPSDVFPELVSDGAFLNFEGVGHPLLPESTCVRNDVDLGPEQRFYLISGSNMAGKSTLLRALGVNAILAATGAPIRARRGVVSGFAVCASIATLDSLLDGKSRFLAEVEHLRDTLLLARGSKPVLFLVDEIFSGTNSTDRRVAAEAVIRELMKAGAVGAISTHDLALTEIAADPDLKGTNVHLASRSDAEPLSFDYKLYPGACRQSNALAIVKMTLP